MKLKNIIIFSIISSISTFFALTAHAGAKLPIKARVLSYNDKRVKLKIDDKIKYLSFKKLTQNEVDSLDRFLDKDKIFHINVEDLHDKE